MQAVFYEEYGDLSKMKIGERARPVPGAKDVLIQMKGAGRVVLSFFIYT
jgi:NADPH:quinone reductase-like Zn-dependent oxidoreductase